MMNLEKMKQKKRTNTKSRVKKSLLAATTFLCLTTPLLQTQTAYAAENTTPAITIEKPDGWKQGETTIAVTVDASHMPEGFSIAKIEAKAGKDGSWQDVTGSGSITITGNQTVYVRVTDGEGKVYEQNRSIKCYDTEKPTLSASLTDGVLTIQGNDTVSGITAVTVNGTTYTDLKDGMLRVQLTQKDFTTNQIEITVTDGAGNTSEKYVLQNPYYEWAKKQYRYRSCDSMYTFLEEIFRIIIGLTFYILAKSDAACACLGRICQNSHCINECCHDHLWSCDAVPVLTHRLECIIGCCCQAVALL